MNGRGYFVNNDSIIEINNTHIDYVFNHPELFDVKKSWLEQIYDRYGDPYGFEGKARTEILAYLLTKGWIRVRETIGRDGRWTVEFDTFMERKESIETFLRWAISESIAGQYEELVLYGFNDGYKLQTSWSEVILAISDLKQ